MAMLCLMLYMLQSVTTQVISHGQVDDFENGTLQGWRMGDYLSAGTTSIAFDVNNISSREVLNLRLAINGGFLDSSFNFIDGLFATAASVSLDCGSGGLFSLPPGDLTAISGQSGSTSNDVLAALGNVTELLLLNSINPDWTGQLVAVTLGIDNITAVVVPLPPTVLLFVSGGLITLCAISLQGGIVAAKK